MAVVFVVTQGIGFLDYRYELGLLDNCSFVVVAFECRGGASAMALGIVLNIPFLIVFYAPLLLSGVIVSLVNTGTVDTRLGIGLTLVISAAIAWFVLGTIGIIRGIVDLARRLRR